MVIMFEKNGHPLLAGELEQHACRAYSLLPNPTLWHFVKDGRQTTVNINPRLMANNAGLEVAMAAPGLCPGFMQICLT